MQDVVLEEDSRELAADVQAKHGTTATTLACLIQLTQTLLRQFGQQHRVDVSPLLEAQRLLVLNWLETREIDKTIDVTAALASLKRAGEALAYLGNAVT